jgi:hypothetical protein
MTGYSFECSFRVFSFHQSKLFLFPILEGFGCFIHSRRRTD